MKPVDEPTSRDVTAIQDTARVSTEDTLPSSAEERAAAANSGPDGTKYFPTARATFDALFDADTDLFNDRDQLVEVPRDQYDECLDLLKTAITNDRVRGVSDPDQATAIIKQGDFTYQQVRNLAIAGNIDALTYHEANQSVTSNFTFAISFAIQFARGKWNGLSDTESIDSAAVIGNETSFVAGLMARHPSLRRLTAAGAVAVRVNMNRLASSQIGRGMIQRLTTAALGRASSGLGMMGHLTKLLRGNFISAILLALTMSIPDLYRAWISKRVSWPQFGKTFATNTAGVVFGVYGWFLGMDIGTALGGAVASGVSAIVIQYFVAFIGGLVGCVIAAVTSRWALDRLVDDDAVRLIDLANESVGDLASDFLLTEQECELFSEEVKSKLTAKWLREMYRSGAFEQSDEQRKQFAYEELQPICANLIAAREQVRVPDVSAIENELERVTALACDE